MKSLKIQEKVSELNKLETTEYIDKQLLKTIIDCVELGQTKYKTLYKNEKEFLLKIYNKLTEKKNELKVTYNNSPEINIGRVYPLNALSLSQIRRPLRHTLAENNYIDIDIKNAQPSILEQICIFNKIDCPNLTKYINDRELILKETQELYNCTREQAKELFIRLMFLGKFNCWVKDENIINKIPTDYIKLLTNELFNIAQFIIKENIEFHNINKKRASYPESSTMSFYLQNIECMILEVIYKYLKSKNLYGTNKLPKVILCHDGLMIKKKELLDTTQLLKELEDEILTKTTFTLKLEIKEFDEKLDIEKLKLEKQLLIDNITFDKIKKFDNKYFNTLNDYELQKKYFELFFCKILSPPKYIFKDEDENKTYTEKKIREMGRHLKNDFMKIWLNDSTIRTYKNEIFEPLNPGFNLNNNNGGDYYNVFPGYNSKITTNITNPDIINDWKNIVLQLCENNKDNYDYYIKWLASMIQNPNKKVPICIIIKSNEGVGKNAHLDAIKKILTNSLYFSSTKKDDFFGKFQIAFNNTLLVNYNEGTNCFDVIEDLKGAITEEYITVEKKGIDKIVFKNHSRIIITTNNNNTIIISDSNRRFIIFQGTDYYKGNTEFWNNYFRLIEQDEFIAALYNYLNSIDLSEWDCNNFPRTKAYEENRMQNIKTEILFINQFIDENKDIMQIKGSDLFNEYRTYCNEGNILCDKLNIKNFYFNMGSLENDGVFGITKKQIGGGRIGFLLNHKLIKESSINKKYIADNNEYFFIN